MRRAERLFRLVNEMRSRGISRACDLAATFEVGPRTIYRDIAHLQASGVPIDGAAGVGYILRPGFDLPPMTFTHAQVDALAIGLSYAESMDDPAIAAAAREVRAKLQAAMPEPEARKLTDAPFFAVGRRTGAPDHARALRDAIRGRRIVTFDYADGMGKSSQRQVHPLAIWTFPDGWMFSGWCALRQDFRTFRFDRITELAATGETYADDPDRGLRAFLAQESCSADGEPARQDLHRQKRKDAFQPARRVRGL